MARKKKETTVETNDVQTNGDEAALAATAEAVPLAQPAEARAPEHPPPQAPQPPANGTGPRRPAASWKFPAAGGVTIEVALWPHQITLGSGETIEVFNTTITRNYKDQNNQWQRGGSFRISEIPVLVHALMRAHGFALDARDMNSPI